jgi:hypothetical protein
LFRSHQTGQLGQQPCAAALERQTTADEDLPDARLLGRDDKVAAQRELAAATRGQAVDAGDEDLLAAPDPLDQPRPAVEQSVVARHVPPVPAAPLGRGLVRAAVLRQIRAGRERDAVTRDHRRPDVRVLTHLVNRGEECSAQRSVDGVALVRAVQPQPRDAVLALVLQPRSIPVVDLRSHFSPCLHLICVASQSSVRCHASAAAPGS